MVIMGCLPTLKCRSLRTSPAAYATPAKAKTITNCAALLRLDICLLPTTLLATAPVHRQVIKHLLLCVRVNQHLLGVNVVRVILDGLLGVPDKRICVLKIRAVSRSLRGNTRCH